MSDIIVQGLTQNNLKHVSFRIPKEKITVFTGVSGSGKSSIVFDALAAESQRQMNATYPAFVRSRLPKHPKPAAERIDNLTASVVIDQSPLGGNARSTVGTISGLYSSLRLLFSRIGKPYAGTASYFSFNDPNGMCKTCSGLGKITKVDIKALIDPEKSWNEGCIKDSLYRRGSWYWRQYAGSGLFDLDKPIKDYSREEYNLLMYGSRDGRGEPENPKITGIYHKYTKTLLNRDISSKSRHTQEKSQNLIAEMECSDCHGKRLNDAALSCKINGYSIADMCEMELPQLKEALSQITDQTVGVLVQTLIEGLDRMIEIGLEYLHLNRETPSLSGGEAQRLKLVRYMGSSLTGLTYIFDEPSAGMHPRDVCRMNKLLKQLRDKGNTVLVVEHDRDVISIADYVIDVGPGAGQNGGQIVFAGNYEELLELVGLDPKRTLDSYPHELSGGQRQRVLIAMALTRDPKVIIADEPTTALDVTVQKQVIDLLNKLQAQLGFAMVFVSHDLALVAEVANSITVMYAGQVVEQGSVHDLLTNPIHEYTRGLLGSVLSIEAGSGRLHQVPGSVPSPKDFPKGDRFAPRSSHPDLHSDVRPILKKWQDTNHWYAELPDDEMKRLGLTPVAEGGVQ